MWQVRLENPTAGHKVVGAIRPGLHEWVDGRHDVVTYRLVQVLSGYGEYLHRIDREETAACHHCGAGQDTA